MSVILKVDDLTEKQQEQLVKELIWKPSNFNAFSETVVKKPFIGYRRYGDVIHVPCYYASKLLGDNRTSDSTKSSESSSNFKPNFDRGLKKQKYKYIGQLRKYQVPLIEQAMQALKLYRGVIFAIYTGGGKTCMISNLICQANEISCIVVTRGNIGDQWAKTFIRDTNLLKENIAMYGTDFPKFKGDIKDVKLVIAVQQSICNIPDELRDKIGTLVLDEAHSLCCPSAMDGILDIHPKYNIIATATPEADDHKFAVMEAIAGKAYVRVRYDPEKERTVYKITTGLTVPVKKQFNGKVDWNYTRDFILYNTRRNELSLCQIMLHPDRKPLVLTFEKAHIDLLVALYEKYGYSVSTMKGTQRNYKNADILIGTFGKIKEGFDQSMTCVDFDGVEIDMIIIMCPIRKRGFLEQVVGRSRAKNALVLHFIDDHPTCNSQWNKDNRIVYKQINFDIEEKNLSEMKLEDVLDGEYGEAIDEIYELFQKKEGRYRWKRCRKLVEKRHKGEDEDKEEDEDKGKEEE